MVSSRTLENDNVVIDEPERTFLVMCRTTSDGDWDRMLAWLEKKARHRDVVWASNDEARTTATTTRTRHGTTDYMDPCVSALDFVIGCSGTPLKIIKAIVNASERDRPSNVPHILLTPNRQQPNPLLPLQVVVMRPYGSSNHGGHEEDEGTDILQYLMREKESATLYDGGHQFDGRLTLQLFIQSLENQLQSSRRRISRRLRRHLSDAFSDDSVRTPDQIKGLARHVWRRADTLYRTYGTLRLAIRTNESQHIPPKSLLSCVMSVGLYVPVPLLRLVLKFSSTDDLGELDRRGNSPFITFLGNSSQWTTVQVLSTFEAFLERFPDVCRRWYCYRRLDKAPSFRPTTQDGSNRCLALHGALYSMIGWQSCTNRNFRLTTASVDNDDDEYEAFRWTAGTLGTCDFDEVLFRLWLRSASHALTTLEPQTRLYPFQLAAVTTTRREPDIDTSYRLLRHDPSPVWWALESADRAQHYEPKLQQRSSTATERGPTTMEASLFTLVPDASRTPGRSWLSASCHGAEDGNDTCWQEECTEDSDTDDGGMQTSRGKESSDEELKNQEELRKNSFSNNFERIEEEHPAND